MNSKAFRTTTEGLKLLNRLPQKYWERFYMIEKESDLIDGCKYMLYLTDNYQFFDGGQSMPVKNLTDAIKWIKESESK